MRRRRKPGASRVASLAVRTHVRRQAERRRRAGYIRRCLFLRWHAHPYRFRGMQRNTHKRRRRRARVKAAVYGALSAWLPNVPPGSQALWTLLARRRPRQTDDSRADDGQGRDFRGHLGHELKQRHVNGDTGGEHGKRVLKVVHAISPLLNGKSAEPASLVSLV